MHLMYMASGIGLISGYMIFVPPLKQMQVINEWEG
jgi:hypothetical protein